MATEFNWNDELYRNFRGQITGFDLNEIINLFKFKKYPFLTLDNYVCKLCALAASNILLSQPFSRCFRKAHPHIEESALLECIREGFVLDTNKTIASEYGYSNRANSADIRTVFINMLYFVNGIEHCGNDFGKTMELLNVIMIIIVHECCHILHYCLVLSKSNAVIQPQSPEMKMDGRVFRDFGFLMEYLLFGGNLEHHPYALNNDRYTDVVSTYDGTVDFLIMTRKSRYIEEKMIVKYNTKLFRTVNSLDDLQFEWRRDFIPNAPTDEYEYALLRKRDGCGNTNYNGKRTESNEEMEKILKLNGYRA